MKTIREIKFGFHARYPALVSCDDYCVPSNLEIFQNCKKIKNLTKYLILKGKINYFHDF